jgi:hypothetical protein
MKKYISSIIVFFVAYFILAVIFEFGETTSVILSLIAAGLFYSSRKEKHVSKSVIVDTTQKEISESDKENEDVEEEELEKDYEFGGIFGAKPRKGTEARRVQEEAKRRKQIAEDKKVKELISELYFSNIEHFPSWIKTDHNREYIPSIISEAVEKKEKTGKDERDKKITEIILNDKPYKFVFQENSFSTPDNAWNTHGLLELFANDKKVLAINVSLEHSDYDSNWSPFGIEAFIDGDWIDDFLTLQKAQKEDEKKRALKEAEDPDKTEKLKRNFGI